MKRQVVGVAGRTWGEDPLEPQWDAEVGSFFLEESLTHKNGNVEPRTDPGLGITVDWDAVDDA